MKNRFLLSIILVLSANIYAQSTFKLLHGGIDEDYNVGLTTSPSGKIITCGSETGINGWNLFQMFYLNGFDHDGNNLWSKELGYIAVHYANVIENTSDGGYIVAGMGKNCTGSTCGEDGLIMKTDSVGNIQWTSAIGYQFPLDYITDIEPTSNGYLFCGTVGHSATGQDWLIGKLDLSGDTLWTTMFSSSLLISDDVPFSIIELSDGSIMVTGRVYSEITSLSLNVGLCKLDASGNIVWFKSAEGLSWGKSILPLSDGFLLCTSTLLIKTDLAGNMVYNKRLPLVLGYRGFESMCFENAAETDVLVCGVVGPDPVLLKANINGTIAWSKYFPITDPAQLTCVKKMNDGRIAMSGKVDGTGSQGTDALLLVTDGFGNLPGGCSTAGTLFTEELPGYSFANQSYYMSNEILYNSLSGVDSILPAANQTFTKTCDAPYFASVNDEQLSELNIYPNPSSDLFNIDGIEVNELASISLIDVLGKRTKLTVAPTIQIQSMPPGIYWLEVKTIYGRTQVIKLVKQ